MAELEELMTAAAAGNEEQILEALRAVLAKGGPDTPLGHFAMGFALGRLYAGE